ncbi:MAG: hypothetical protein AB1847_09215 [bacterium]
MDQVVHYILPPLPGERLNAYRGRFFVGRTQDLSLDVLDGLSVSAVPPSCQVRFGIGP